MKKFALVFLLFLTACVQTIPTPAVVSTPTDATITNTFTLVPLPSGTPIPSVTIIPSATPIVNPMAIETLRQGTYPGSDIVTVNELERGSNYRRYYAYYLSEGLKIYGLLTIPDGEMPAGGWPAIIFNHGYIPPDIYRTTERYIAYVDRIASSGYIVFRIDYRGNDKSEGVAKGAYGDPGYLIDVLNAVASIKKFPQANPEKIGMWGHSMGGFLTLRAMVISKDIKVGVIWAGVVGSYPDLLYNWHRTGASVTPSPSSEGVGWRSQWIKQYGTPEAKPAFWNAVSANSYLADLSGPLQLHHGTADTDVPLAFSQTLYEQIRGAGKYAELYTYPGDNHNIAASFDLAMTRTIEFYDQYLK
jgi:dipeptidyl aminopeptidase/acylaminoacyl peptidase